MIGLRGYCEFAGTATAGAWHRLLAEKGVERGASEACEEHGVRRGKLGECYRNAAIASLEHEGLTYVQGVAFSAGCPGLPIEHGWCETADGRVVEMTWEEGLGYLGIAVDDGHLRDWLLRVQVYGQVDGELVKELRGRRTVVERETRVS